MQVRRHPSLTVWTTGLIRWTMMAGTWTMTWVEGTWVSQTMVPKTPPPRRT